MKLSKHLTPYPILNHEDDDYVKGSFDSVVEDDLEFGMFTLRIKYLLDEPELAKLIKEGKACFLTHIECTLTGYRHFVESREDGTSVTIPTSELADQVEISSFVVAVKDIDDYKNPAFNELGYGKNASFHIDATNVLAIGATTYQLDIKRGQQAYESIGDIIALKAIDSPKDDLKVSLDQDCIFIQVNRDIFNLYDQYKSAKKYTMISLLIMPALTKALIEMHNNEQTEDGTEGLESYQWYQVIQDTLTVNGISVADISLDPGDTNYAGDLAERIFRMPLLKAMQELADPEEEEADEE